MKNVPPSVRVALKKRGADSILNQEGDYYDFKPQIDAIIHKDEDMSGYMGDMEPMDIEDMEEELSPAEKKANDRIEELGSKYKSVADARAAYDRGEISRGELDDIVIADKTNTFEKAKEFLSSNKKAQEIANEMLENGIPYDEATISAYNTYMKQNKIYQYPSDLSEDDIKKAKEFGLEYLGDVDEDGIGVGDKVIRGKYSDLDRFNKEHLGYEFNEDYLYDDGDFNTDILVNNSRDEIDARPNETKFRDLNLSDSEMWNMAYKYIGQDKLDKLAEQLDLESSQDIPTNELLKYMSDSDIEDMMIANGLDDYFGEEDENLSPMEKSLFNYKPEPLTDEQKELVKEHFENENKERLINRLKKSEVPQEQIDSLVKEFKGKDLENAVEQLEKGRPFGDVMSGTVKYEDDEITKNFNYFKEAGYEDDEAMKKAKSKAENDSMLKKLENTPNKQNWYDGLSDESPHARDYKEDAMKVNPERAALISKVLDEYVSEKPQRGFITNEQLKKYGERLGLDKLSDRDLRTMWSDVHNVAGYKAFGTPYDKGGRELEDAQSAFAEVVNQEARNRKAKGNYFPYDESDINDAKYRIREIIAPHENYDLDNAMGYLSGKELGEIERIANEYHLSDDDLEKISRNFFGEMGYRGRGWKNPEDAKTVSDFRKMVKDNWHNDAEMENLAKLSDKQILNLMKGIKNLEKLWSKK